MQKGIRSRGNEQFRRTVINNASFVSRERVTVSVLFSLRKESERKELIDPLTCTTVPRPRP